jgi:hypothetical protein
MTAPTEADETAAPTETAGDHLMVPEDDRDMSQGLDMDPAGVITAGDPQSPGPAAPERAGATDAEPEPTRAAPVAGDSAGADARWHEILTMFVDDPRSSVALAAGLVDDSAEVLVTSVRERQHALLSVWQGDDAGTEEMRIALQQYRTFWSRIEDLSREA